MAQGYIQGGNPLQNNAPKLKRQLNLANGVSVICGLIIGSGIYISPGGVIRGTGSVALALLIWLLAGAMGTIGALCFAELGTTFSRSGEKYVYLREMYGEFAAFLYLWMYLMLFRPGANAIKAFTFARYILQPFYPQCQPPDVAVSLLAISLVFVLTFINIVKIKWSANGQTVVVMVTTLLLLTIGVLGLTYISSGKTEYIAPPQSVEGTTWDVGGICLAFYSAIFASWGWNALNFMVDELREPYKNLPRAIYLSMLIVTTLFVLVNLSYFSVLGPHVVATSPAVAVTFAQKVMGPFSWVVPIGVAVSCFGSFNSGTLVASRLAFAGAQRGHLPEVLSLVNIRFLSPITSLLFQFVIVILMCLTAELYSLLNYVVFCNTVIDVFCMAGMLHLRVTKPHLHRPLKFPLALPLMFLICMSFLACVTAITRPRDVLLGGAMVLATAIPYYVIIIKCAHKLPQAWRNVSAKFTRLVQISLYCTRSSDQQGDSQHSLDESQHSLDNSQHSLDE